MVGPDTQQYLYVFLAGDRPELATDLTAWTEDDELISAEHFAYLSAGVAEGTVVMAGRSQDGIGPAIVILEVQSEEDASQFMEGDPFLTSGLFRASLHPFRTALQRKT
ncbi:MAG: YciI family protein [Acidimicrobiia bacterium]